MQSPRGWWQGLEDRTKRLAGIISAIGVVVGGAIAGGHWVINSIDNRIAIQTNAISQEVAELRVQSEANDAESEKSLKRLELMALIRNNPENKAEIEKVAYHYFVTLDGDWYATEFYSNWAAKYGGDITIVVKK